MLRDNILGEAIEINRFLSGIIMSPERHWASG